MKYTTRKWIMMWRGVRMVRQWMKDRKFQKYDQLSLYNFLRIFTHNIKQDEIGARASGVSYNFILATFPAIIFLFTLIPYIKNYFPRIDEDAIMRFLESMMPTDIYELVSSTMLDIVSNQRGGLLTFGFLVSLFLATNGMMALMRAFNACYRTVEKRNPILMRLTATGLTIMMSLSLIVVILLLVVGKFLLLNVTENITAYSHIEMDNLTVYLLFVVRFSVIFLVFFLVISCIYYFGPAIQKNWHFFSKGSLFATLAVLGICYGFSYYISNFGTYNKLYGSIGALIALMIWIQLITTVLLLGYEINASFHYGRQWRRYRNNIISVSSNGAFISDDSDQD